MIVDGSTDFGDAGNPLLDALKARGTSPLLTNLVASNTLRNTAMSPALHQSAPTLAARLILPPAASADLGILGTLGGWPLWKKALLLVGVMAPVGYFVVTSSKKKAAPKPMVGP